jgi:hypothetical protein
MGDFDWDPLASDVRHEGMKQTPSFSKDERGNGTKNRGE